MNKYIHELKQVTWPEANKVVFYFWVTVICVLLLCAFFFSTDAIITMIFDKLYT